MRLNPLIPNTGYPLAELRIQYVYTDGSGVQRTEEEINSCENLLDILSNIGYTIVAKEKAMSSVGVSFGLTIRTEPYSSARVDVSVQLPCADSDQAREAACKAGLAFCRKQVQDVADEIEAKQSKGDCA